MVVVCQQSRLRGNDLDLGVGRLEARRVQVDELEGAAHSGGGYEVWSGGITGGDVDDGGVVDGMAGDELLRMDGP